jgi:hypothetical protein
VGRRPHAFDLSDVSVIQLICSSTSIYRKLEKRQCSPVMIKGKLFNSDNGNHRAAVLLGDCQLASPR